MKQVIKITIALSSILHFAQTLHSQVTVGANNGISTDFVGWDANQNFPLTIAHKRTSTPQPINFLTNNIQRATILSDGSFGIGLTSPTHKLHVAGNINIDAITNTYKIAGTNVLKITGNAFPTSSTYIGYDAGANTTARDGNTYVGTEAGYNTGASSEYNTFVGWLAGYNNDARDNTFVGSECGFSNTYGIRNYFFGEGCGYRNTTGNNNVYIGHEASYMNVTGSDNITMGYYAGYGASTYSYSKNILLGSSAGAAIKTAGDNIAIGYQALTTQNYANSGSAWSSYNVAIGNYALYTTNASASTTQGISNTAIGHNAGYFNSTGNYNTITGFEAGKGTTSAAHSDNAFYGYQAGKSVTTGSNNVFIGFQSGFTHSTNGANVYCGYKSGYSNSSGHSNSFYGQNSGFYNTTGENNVSLGLASTYYNATGSNNTNCGYGAGFGVSGVSTSNNSFFGYKAAYSCSTGSGNVAVGYQAGYTITTGSNNTFIGNSSNLNAGTYSNSGAFGYNTVVTASNKIYMGDANLSGCYNYPAAGWLSYSDQRFKFNVKEEVKGLEFILKLRPVTYQFDSKAATEFVTQNFPDSLRGNYLNGVDFSASTNKIQSGFLAQEVDQAAKDCGFANSIVSPPSNDGDMYALSYGGFVVPLVKAVQELSKALDSLKSEIVTLKGGGQRGNGTNNSQGLKEATSQIDLANNSQPILYQNEPNPFDGSTVIRYFIPENISGNAFVVFYDMYGKEVNKLEIRERGFGKIEANTENLAAGIYSYSILVDGKAIDTKKMLKAK